ncbi:hypothetical protein HY11_04155 [Hyphomonas pacifica]|nr:hypothetical protein HY11_04155 [Hyphomonas pacifica]
MASEVILVIGRTGQVAQALAHVCGAQVVCLGRPDADLKQPETLVRALELHQPLAVINAGGFTLVDQAEAEPDEARILNVDGPAALASAREAQVYPWFTCRPTAYLMVLCRAPTARTTRPARFAYMARQSWMANGRLRRPAHSILSSASHGYSRSSGTILCVRCCDLPRLARVCQLSQIRLDVQHMRRHWLVRCWR